MHSITPPQHEPDIDLLLVKVKFVDLALDTNTHYALLVKSVADGVHLVDYETGERFFQPWIGEADAPKKPGIISCEVITDKQIVNQVKDVIKSRTDNDEDSGAAKPEVRTVTTTERTPSGGAVNSQYTISDYPHIPANDPLSYPSGVSVTYSGQSWLAGPISLPAIIVLHSQIDSMNDQRLNYWEDGLRQRNIKLVVAQSIVYDPPGAHNYDLDPIPLIQFISADDAKSKEFALLPPLPSEVELEPNELYAIQYPSMLECILRIGPSLNDEKLHLIKGEFSLDNPAMQYKRKAPSLLEVIDVVSLLNVDSSSTINLANERYANKIQGVSK